MKANRTEILFSTANKLYRFAIYNLQLFNKILNRKSKIKPKEY